MGMNWIFITTGRMDRWMQIHISYCFFGEIHPKD
uniref:Uncharacterized protein n=1 Tax=Lepeophtheirus salmonis TaxID=72036 RepID=A0A0K2TME3_LEPSM